MSSYIKPSRAAAAALTIRIDSKLKIQLESLQKRARAAGASLDLNKCCEDALTRLVKDASRALDAMQPHREKATPAGPKAASSDVPLNSLAGRSLP